jgi:hypothetical protein
MKKMARSLRKVSPHPILSLAELIRTKDKTKKIAASIEFSKTFNGRSAKTDELLALNLTSGSRIDLIIAPFKGNDTKQSRDKEITDWLLYPQNLGSIIE